MSLSFKAIERKFLYNKNAIQMCLAEDKCFYCSNKPIFYEIDKMIHVGCTKHLPPKQFISILDEKSLFTIKCLI